MQIPPTCVRYVLGVMNKSSLNQGAEIISRNPATGEILKRFESHSDQELEKRLQRAVEAFENIRRLSVNERARRVNQAGAILDKEKAELGRLMTLEMGKPIVAAIQEAEKCALGCRFYAQNGEGFLAPEQVQTQNTISYVRFDPL